MSSMMARRSSGTILTGVCTAGAGAGVGAGAGAGAGVGAGAGAGDGAGVDVVWPRAFLALVVVGVGRVGRLPSWT